MKALSDQIKEKNELEEIVQQGIRDETVHEFKFNNNLESGGGCLGCISRPYNIKIQTTIDKVLTSRQKQSILKFKLIIERLRGEFRISIAISDRLCQF